MIRKDKEDKLIEVYLYVCQEYETNLQFYCQRFSNNDQPEFTDQEIMTIYLFVINQEQRFKIKQIYQFAQEYLFTWFPKLPSYSAFNNRLNQLSEAFRHLTGLLFDQFKPTDCSENESLLDSLPIITCSGKRSGKVAPEITAKGYCSTKSMFYYGLKLHSLAFRRNNQLPFPEQLLITPASENDLNVFKQAWGSIENRTFYGDKIYLNEEYFALVQNNHNSVMLTPVKGIKNQSIWEMQFSKASDDLFSVAVSKCRQPIESFFNWLIEKTDFQRASKVRSTKGLLIHTFGKIAAAFIGLIFNS